MQGRKSLAWKVTMSLWFISPWEAVRFSLEAQRLIALQFFPFATRQEQRREEVALDDKTTFVTPQNIGSLPHGAIPPRSSKIIQARTVAARNATEVIRKASKSKRVKGRRTSKNRKRA
jgi:hypothetical protein